MYFSWYLSSLPKDYNGVCLRPYITRGVAGVKRNENAATHVDDLAAVRLCKTLLIFLSTAGMIIAFMGMYHF